MIDWDADPRQLLLDGEDSNAENLRVIWLRDGTASYWHGEEPNQKVLDYLRIQKR